jgi:hypothetical protein
MSHRFPRRALAAVALAASLALPLPAHAASPRPWPLSLDLLQRARLWLAEVWTGSPRPQPAHEKAGMGVNPDGSPDSSTTSPCTGECERGAGVDPDG